MVIGIQCTLFKVESVWSSETVLKFKGSRPVDIKWAGDHMAGKIDIVCAAAKKVYILIRTEGHVGNQYQTSVDR